ncbi:MAG TPA: single-stranded DNA-binding protein [Bacillota bacterium]|jgi:single-strand DNA-binding protein|nr:single-stranded DNA-binding protein [Fastidiosipila sp.]HPX93716.1 single-stranded DNA-binding protein [Bacillota bacterium]HQB81464.1 single-stranded DNA-binding protein [Bacillota bacterium]
MNKAILMGRLVRDPEIRTTQSGVSVCNFTVACDRRSRSAEGTRQSTADFIPCVAWRQQAEFINKYFYKGDRILITGTIQPRSWEDQAGQRRYTTEVIVDEVEFCESRRGDRQVDVDEGPRDYTASTPVESGGDDFLTTPDDEDTALPFDF